MNSVQICDSYIRLQETGAYTLGEINWEEETTYVTYNWNVCDDRKMKRFMK
jgi:hypothetical protein